MVVLFVVLVLLLLSVLGWRWNQIELSRARFATGRMMKFHRRRRGGRRLAP
jgi:hypothetical protein